MNDDCWKFAKWDQKTKRGKPKNEKLGLGVGGVLEKICEFYLAYHEYNAKNRLDVGWGLVGRKSILKSDG